MAISADGARVVTRSSMDELTKVWDGETGACLRTLQDLTGNVSSVAISADGARVVTTPEGSVEIWDAPRFPRHALAFAMALHPRLGAGCFAKELDPVLVQLIGEQVVGPCWDWGSARLDSAKMGAR